MLDKFQVSHLNQLLQEGCGLKEISRIMGISINTVRRYHRNIPSKSRNSAVHQEMESKREAIKELFFKCKGNCKVVQRQLTEIIDTEPHIRLLQRFCKPFRIELRQARNTITTRFETKPGHQMQIDFGELDLEIGGEIRRVHIFEAKLSYSRRIFSKAYFNERQGNWMDGIESALIFFGGVPHEIVCDNAAALVKDRSAPKEERFTETFAWLCHYYGMEPVATAVRKPNSKGKVESAVKYVKNNALVNVKFRDLEELEEYLAAWSVETNDTHTINDPLLEGAKTPGERWLVEKPALRPLDKAPIAALRRVTRKVTKNGLIYVGNLAYRVPDSFIFHSAEVLVGKETITVTCNGQTHILDKAKDVFKPEVQGSSNTATSAEKFNNAINGLAQDASWEAMQNPQVERSTSEYDALFTSGRTGGDVA